MISDPDGKTTIKIVFENQKAAWQFAMWMCESGEQTYWDWMEAREQEEFGAITAVDFEYFQLKDASKSEDDEERYGEFMEDNTILAACGRLDEYDDGADSDDAYGGDGDPDDNSDPDDGSAT